LSFIGTLDFPGEEIFTLIPPRSSANEEWRTPCPLRRHEGTLQETSSSLEENGYVVAKLALPDLLCKILEFHTN